MSPSRLWLPSLFALAVAGAACSDLGDVRQNGGGGGGGGADAGDVGGADAGGELGENLSVTMTTTPVGGPFAPNNNLAVWIEDAAGNYVDTIAYYAGPNFQQYLLSWRAASGLQQADVVSGATRPSHGAPVTATWDIGGAATPPADGTYTLRIEIADSNAATPDQNHQASFPFDLNGTASTQDLNGQGLQAITLDYSGRE